MKQSASGRWRATLAWFGFGPEQSLGTQTHEHDKPHSGGHGHVHGVVDPTIATTSRGIWAIKWSFVILSLTAAFQITVVLFSGSVALLADSIHNVGDAATAVPLWIAFRLARRKPSPRFTYGYGRVEDFAGVVIVLIILISAIVAGYAAIDRLLHPQPIQLLLWVTIAGCVGFVGNEAAAVLRIKVGREINSAALIADGYHARTDGLTSLAVVAGAFGVWLGFPYADPIVGLLITIAIFGIVWQSARAVFTRMLDGVEPSVIEEIRHAATHVPGIRAVREARARWLGHRLVAELDIAIDGTATVREADALASTFEHKLMDHLPALASARVRIRSSDAAANGDAGETGTGSDGSLRHAEHSAPAPVAVRGKLAHGCVEIIATPAGERMRFTGSEMAPNLEVEVAIHRAAHPSHPELLPLEPVAGTAQFQSTVAPAEPHEFAAELRLRNRENSEVVPFLMHKPHDHH